MLHQQRHPLRLGIPAAADDAVQVDTVKVLLPPPLEGGAGDAAHLGCSLYEVDVAFTPVGFM